MAGGEWGQFKIRRSGQGKGYQQVQPVIGSCSTIAAFIGTGARRFFGQLIPPSGQHHLGCHGFYPAHLVRTYQRVFGETPSEFTNRLREQDAWHLVTSTELSIQDIAARLGYGNQSAFCRVFKAIFGMTASQARLSDSAVQHVGWRRISSPTGIGP